MSFIEFQIAPEIQFDILNCNDPKTFFFGLSVFNALNPVEPDRLMDFRLTVPNLTGGHFGDEINALAIRFFRMPLQFDPSWHIDNIEVARFRELVVAHLQSRQMIIELFETSFKADIDVKFLVMKIEMKIPDQFTPKSSFFTVDLKNNIWESEFTQSISCNFGLHTILDSHVVKRDAQRRTRDLLDLNTQTDHQWIEDLRSLGYIVINRLQCHSAVNCWFR